MGTRDRMLDAAAQVMRTRGLARTTTKEIAKEAGYSEAALYKHFRDKTEIFLTVLTERVPGNLGALLAVLNENAREGSVEDALRDVAREALGFYQETFVMAASVFAEPQLLAAHRAEVYERGAGPQIVRDVVANYIAAEQDRGRVRADIEPTAVAGLLLGACFQQAFLSRFAGAMMDDETVELTAAELVHALFSGLAPDP